jgi:hypothetical protein
MSLYGKLALVLLAFLALLAWVIVMAFRARTQGATLARDDIVGQQAADARLLAVIFSAILGGMLLALLSAWLIFF